jgi:zinc protease
MGIAHLTAETLRLGTTTQSAEALADEIDSAGVTLRIGVDDDVVMFDCTARAADLGLCLDRLADITQRPTLPPKEVERMRVELIAQGVHEPRDELSSLARAHGSAAYFGDDDPRGRSPSERSLKAISRADLLAFHKARYRPDGAMLVVSGDVTMASLRAHLARKRGLGTWPSAGALPEVVRVLPGTRPLRVRLVDKPEATQTAFLLLGPGIARGAADLFATQFANYILGGGDFSSRLMRVVRAESGKAYNVRSVLDAGRDPGIFSIASATRVPESGQALRLILDEVKKLRASGPTQAELDATRGNQLGGFARSLETAADLASTLASAALHGLPDDFVERSPARMAALKLDDLKRAAAAHFGIELIVAVGPAAQVGPLLTAIGLKIDETVPYDVAVNAADRLPAAAAR